MHDHVHARVERVHGVARAVHLGTPDVVRAVQHLALEVAQLDVVVVDHAQMTDPRGREVGQHGCTQSPGADHADAGRRQAALPDLAHLREQQVPRPALHLRGRQRRAGRDQRGQRHHVSLGAVR